MSAPTHISCQTFLSSCLWISHGAISVKMCDVFRGQYGGCSGPTVASQQVEVGVGVQVLPVLFFQVLQLPLTVHRHGDSFQHFSMVGRKSKLEKKVKSAP